MARNSEKGSLRLDVESLRVFLEVVDRGGFTAASKTLGITQPAVSLKIRRLEERIGAKLLLRQGRTLVVTAHGRDLLAHAAKVVDDHDRAVDHMRRSRLHGAVRLGFHTGAVSSGLLEVASRFNRTHPDIDLAIRVSDSGRIAEMLEDGAIDIALMLVLDCDDAVRPTDEIWRRDELCVVQGLEVDFTDEDPVPLVSYGSEGLYEPHLVAALQAAGRAHRVSVECPSVSGVRKAVEAGLGVAVVHSHYVTEQVRPWTGLSPLELPPPVLVVRSRPDADNYEPIEALRSRLAVALARDYTEA